LKNVLFITYYWPPSGKAALHWPLKMIKYLPEHNWQPYVLTVDEDTFSDKDTSLLKDIDSELVVKKTSSFDVFKFYKKFMGKKSSESVSISETMSKETQGIKNKLALWIRMNLFVPDARIGWKNYAVRGGKELINDLKEKDLNIDIIISIGTPHSTHLIAYELSRIFNIPYMPVFTDPWTSINYYKYFKRNSLTLFIDEYLEKKILLNSAHTIFVTQNTEEEYIKKFPSLKNKTNVLYWGYNEDDFENLNVDNKSNEEEIILHSGNISDYQNPNNFWKTIKERIESGIKTKLVFTGTIGPKIIESIHNAGLKDNFEFLGFLPYKELLKRLDIADYLLVCPYDKNHVPGKLFEYLRIGKPIIAFCDDNEEVSRILSSTNAGILFNYSDNGKIFFDRINEFKTDFSSVKQFDRKVIAAHLAEILDNLV